MNPNTAGNGRKSPHEARDERLLVLAEPISRMAMKLARQWDEDFEEVQQFCYHHILTLHEASVAKGLPLPDCFLFQTTAYILTSCKWAWSKHRRHLRLSQATDDAGLERIAGAVEDKAIVTTGKRLAVKDALEVLSPELRRFCELLMQGFNKGEAGRIAGGWSPKQRSAAVGRVRAVFVAAGM